MMSAYVCVCRHAIFPLLVPCSRNYCVASLIMIGSLAYTVSLQLDMAGTEMSKWRLYEALIKACQGWVSHLIKESKFNLYLLSLQTL